MNLATPYCIIITSNWGITQGEEELRIDNDDIRWLEEFPALA
jgi:hypothetical protein